MMDQLASYLVMCKANGQLVLVQLVFISCPARQVLDKFGANKTRRVGHCVCFAFAYSWQDVSLLVGALLAIVGGKDQTACPSEAPRGAGAGAGGAGSGRGGGEEEPGADAKRMGRERVVLLMHETRVLSASDATRLLLLLSREV